MAIVKCEHDAGVGREARVGSLADLRWLFETSPDLIFITDRRGTFTHISPSSEAILGYRPDEMIGRSGADFIYPEDLDPTRDEMRLARGGRHTRNFEARYVHKKGRVVTLTWSGAWSEDGQQHSFIGREVTERKLVDEKFRLAVEASPGGMVMIDAAGSIVLVNAETERMFGYARAELIGQSVDILVPADFRHHHTGHRSGFAAAPQARRMGLGRDLHGLRKDGSAFPVEIGLNPIRTRSGLFVLSVVVDISERKRAEAAAQEYVARERLYPAAIIASSNDVIITKNLDGRISGWNPAAERLFGFTAEEAIGSSVDIIIPDNLRSEERLILERIGKGDRVEHFETTRKSKDGRLIDVSLSISPIKLPSGEVIGAAKIGRDITERKRAKQELLESEQMAMGIIFNALDAFIQLNQAGAVIEWNPQAEAIFGWSRQEAIGKSVADLSLAQIYELRYSQMVERLQQADEHTTGERFVIATRRKNGLNVMVEVSMTAIRRRGSYVLNVFVRDLTAKLAAEEQLRQSQKIEAIGKLTGGIAHDFNNLLAAITGNLELAERVIRDEKPREWLRNALEAVEMGKTFNQRLLSFARKSELDPERLVVNCRIPGIAALLARTLGEHIELTTDLAPDLWPTLADPGEIDGAILNLAVNARDAMPEAGKLFIRTRNVTLDVDAASMDPDARPDDYVQLSIIDTGAGMSQEVLQHAIEPFFTTKEPGKGTGLGLSSVFGFAKQSGGFATLESQVGKGTTVKLYLPRAAEGSVQKHAGQTDSSPQGDGQLILVVEDADLVRKVTLERLEALGYAVIEARSGPEAIERLKSDEPIALVFSDIVMSGGMTGHDLARWVLAAKPCVKVLLTSGYNAEGGHNAIAGIKVLAKPYTFTELAHSIHEALDTAPAQADVTSPVNT
jgi:PAS domain S-box-containing protein